MKKQQGLIAAICAMLAFASAPLSSSAAENDSADALNVEVTTCPNPAPDSEDADLKAFHDVVAAFNNGGFRALGERTETLRTVVGHSPECYPMIEKRGDKILVRTSDVGEFLVLSMLIQQTQKDVSVEQMENVYPLAYFLLGSNANETHNFSEATDWLDRGLTLQPDNWMLISEKAVALQALHKQAEVVDLIQKTFDRNIFLAEADQARFKRMLGVALIDLNRLDEAEAALKELLKLEPGNSIAKNELKYIKQLRKGAPPTETQVTTSASATKD